MFFRLRQRQGNNGVPFSSCFGQNAAVNEVSRKMFHQAKMFWVATILILVSVPSVFAHAEESGDNGSAYPILESALDETEAAIERALEQEKLALVILGAHWCHDSKALARRLDQPALREVLDDRYETLLVGLGYYEHGFDVAERLGIEIYTHTPTVLIYDPKSESIVNIDDHHIWRESARLTDDETLTYFKEKSDPDNWSQAFGTDDLALRAFEKKQAERLRDAYRLLGPMLEEDADDLDTFWGPVRDFRYQFTDDLNRLRQEARAAAAAGKPFEPEWPEYEPFPWEVSGE